MKEIYMPFNGEMVRAILEGRKTLTHRPVKFPKWIQPSEYEEAVKAMNKSAHMAICERGPADGIIGRWKCPYGEPGDLMCVRETYQSDGRHTAYKASPETWPVPERVKDGTAWINWHWRPSIHMPKWACRKKKLIISVRAERIQFTSEMDAIAEGFNDLESFIKCYDSLYPCAWERNEWSWRVEWIKEAGQ